MWESFAKMVDSANFFKFALFIIILVAIAIYCIKNRILNISTKHVQIGDSDDRLLIRNQMEYAETSCKAQFNKIVAYCENEYQARFIIAEVIDVFQKAIIYNHLDSNDDGYVRSKKNLVLLTIQKHTQNEHFFGSEFRSCCDKFVEDLIRDLDYMKKLHLK